MVEFLAYSGMRIEEARRLEWKDIGKESISVPDIKHATERRTLYINPSLQDVIGGIRAHHKQPNGANKVFVVQSPRKALTNACIRLGIAHVRVHDLRHFFATSCIESGIDIPTVSRWLGHKDGGALAMKVYGHLRDAHSREQAARVRF
ncbi:MAG: tyrosine-type recombinase/integrase [Akkermansia sp.]